MTEIKPAAWVERTEEGLTRMWSSDLATWANRPAKPEPLYDQATVDSMRRDAERWRELVGTWGGMAQRGRHVEIGISTPRWKVPLDVESFGEAFDRRYELDDAMNGANDELSRAGTASA